MFHSPSDQNDPHSNVWIRLFGLLILAFITLLARFESFAEFKERAKARINKLRSTLAPYGEAMRERVRRWFEENEVWQEMNTTTRYVVLPLLAAGMVLLFLYFWSTPFSVRITNPINVLKRFVLGIHWDLTTIVIIALGFGLCVFLYRFFRKKSPEGEPSRLDLEGIWEEWKELIFITIGIILLNFFLAYVEPFNGWHQTFRTNVISFILVNLMILFGIYGLIKFNGEVGKWVWRVAATFVAVAIVATIWNYGKNNWDWWKTEKSDSTKTKTQTVADNSVTFTGDARDLPAFSGPERDSVMEFFSDNLMMADIAAAESNFNHWKPSVSRDSIRPGCDDVERNENTNGTYDLGVMQINSIHKARADSLGIDICTLGGNLLFAQKLYDTEGERPWISSQAVWREHYLNPNAMVSEDGMKVQFIETATVGPWSEWIDGKGCKIGFRGVNHRNISIAVANSPDEPSVIYSFDPKAKGQPQEIPSGRYIRFRSNTETKVTIRMEVEC